MKVDIGVPQKRSLPLTVLTGISLLAWIASSYAVAESLTVVKQIVVRLASMI